MNGLTFQTVESPDKAVIVTASGSGGMEAGEALRLELARIGSTQPKHVVLDLAQTQYLSSVCIGVIMRFNQTCATWGGRLSVVTPPGGMIDGTLRHAALHKVLHIEPSVATALATKSG
jgi:anti-anti-sigma factor